MTPVFIGRLEDGRLVATIATREVSVVPSVGDELTVDGETYRVTGRRWELDDQRPWCHLFVGPLVPAVSRAAKSVIAASATAAQDARESRDEAPPGEPPR